MEQAETRVCAYSECNNEFAPRTHNMRYCSADCCRLATNAEIMRKYYERKARKAGIERICMSNGCDTRLSRYNENDICQSCTTQSSREQRDNIWRRFNGGPIPA